MEVEKRETVKFLRYYRLIYRRREPSSTSKDHVDLLEGIVFILSFVILEAATEHCEDIETPQDAQGAGISAYTALDRIKCGQLSLY
jgi:hypothetical protein